MYLLVNLLIKLPMLQCA